MYGDRGNDRIDGGAGYDAGQGGYHDGRLDWIVSVERPLEECLPFDETFAWENAHTHGHA